MLTISCRRSRPLSSPPLHFSLRVGANTKRSPSRPDGDPKHRTARPGSARPGPAASSNRAVCPAREGAKFELVGACERMPPPMPTLFSPFGQESDEKRFDQNVLFWSCDGFTRKEQRAAGPDRFDLVFVRFGYFGLVRFVIRFGAVRYGAVRCGSMWLLRLIRFGSRLLGSPCSVFTVFECFFPFRGSDQLDANQHLITSRTLRVRRTAYAMRKFSPLLQSADRQLVPLSASGYRTAIQKRKAQIVNMINHQCLDSFSLGVVVFFVCVPVFCFL